MKALIEKLYKNRIPHNEGYTFICNEDIYIPIFQVYLSVTKRVSIPLNIVEEKTLELINVGVHSINEISDILGLERGLLEITIADLYTKDMIYSASNNCKLLSKGRDALKSLERSERKPELLKEVYVDSITGDILSNVEQLNLIENMKENDDYKLKAVQNINDIDFFCKKFNEVNMVFEKEMLAYQDLQREHSKQKTDKELKDELISIDSIDRTFVKFYKVPICLYISNTGYDIDIVPMNKKLLTFMEQHKMLIIEQIRNRKIMNKIFSKYSLAREYSKIDFDINLGLEKRITNFYLNKQKDDIDLEIIKSNIFDNRKLADGELGNLLPYLIKESETIEIYVDKIDDFAWDTKFITMLTTISSKINYKIHYNFFNDSQKAIRQIKKTVTTFKDNHINESHSYYLKYAFNSNIEIIGIPYNVCAFESSRKVKKIDYYLICNNN